MAHERFNTLLMGIFSAIGLGLAAVGIYGVVSYTVSQRRAEFGIRMALGAEGRDVRGLMLRTSSTMASLGVGVGIIIAYVASPAVQTLLRTGNPRAPLAYILAAAVLMVTTIVAAWIPTRRATRTSLSETLRP
jgi:ABC-type antimicrobial peptide transport system permease subunit